VHHGPESRGTADHPRPPALSVSEARHPRAIRSFVTRSGRITVAQERALEELWPKYGLELGSAPLELEKVFGRRAPCVAEIGFGNGENLVSLAAARPESDFVGVEVHRPGVGRLLRQLAEHDLTNVRVIVHDAVAVFEQHLAPASLDEILILFPDPWPKKRHHKRRLIQGPFASALAERLKPGGRLHLATDWEPYALEMLATLEAQPRLANLAPGGEFAPRPLERPATRFERRGQQLGHRVWELAFSRV
jgi:tRNA (guanine-N7-)-methyltransferase